MNDVRMIEQLEPGGQIHVGLAREVDLDDLLLHLLAGEDLGRHWEDEPTRLAEWPEVEVGRFRKVPCGCGEGHTYDVWPVGNDENPRGSYLGAMTR